jgi:hypothetical protein
MAERPASTSFMERVPGQVANRAGDRLRSSRRLKAIDVYLLEQDAQRALEDCLRDEPQWRGRLKVTEVELDHAHTSLN